MINRRILGIVLLVAGISIGLWIAWRAFDAMVNGIFLMIVSDVPNQRFERMTCPPVILLPGQTAAVRVRIFNRLDQPQEYGLGLMTDTFSVKSAPGQSIMIPAGKSEIITWTVEVPRAGKLALAVSATSSLDSASNEMFHTWPNSYRQACGSLALSMEEVSVLTVGVVLLIFGAVLLCYTPLSGFAARAKRERGWGEDFRV